MSFSKLRGRAAEGLWRHAVAADGERKAPRGGLDEVPVDVHVMPESLPERREISPRETPVSGTSSLMSLVQALERLRAAKLLRWHPADG